MEMHQLDGALWSFWQFAPEITIPILVLAALYLRKSNADTKELIYFFIGVASILAVVITPVGARSADFFSFHMVQHITLMMIAGPCLVLGTPASFTPKGKLFSTLTNIWLSWFLYAILMIGVHLPGPHLWIMNNPWAHKYLEVPLYIVIPYFFYFNLLDRKLESRKISPAIAVIALFLMMVPETLTGFAIYVSHGSLYNDMYSINDQRRGGSLMWSGSMIIDTIWMSMAVSSWLKFEEMKTSKID